MDGPGLVTPIRISTERLVMDEAPIVPVAAVGIDPSMCAAGWMSSALVLEIV